MKERLARFGVDYASRILGLSEIEVLFKPQSFFKFDQTNAFFIPEGYYIVFNTDWLNIANELEILKCSFHETRHAYQKACIDFPNLIHHNPTIVSIWAKEFDEYIEPRQASYMSQEIEQDAIEFSDLLILQLGELNIE